jgi:hypothetical protein
MEALPARWIPNRLQDNWDSVKQHLRIEGNERTIPQFWTVSRNANFPRLSPNQLQAIAVYKSVSRHLWRRWIPRGARKRIVELSRMTMINGVSKARRWDANLLDPLEAAFLYWKSHWEGVEPFWIFRQTGPLKSEWRDLFLLARGVVGVQDSPLPLKALRHQGTTYLKTWKWGLEAIQPRWYQGDYCYSDPFARDCVFTDKSIRRDCLTTTTNRRVVRKYSHKQRSFRS